MKRTLFIVILFVGIGMLDYGNAEEDTVLSLPSLIDEALLKNTMLLTKENQVKAFEERIPPAGTLPDPMLKLGLANLPEEFDFNESPMSQKQIALSQKFPFPGKLRLKEEIARDEYNLSKAELDYNQLEIINRVKTAYYSLFFIDKSIKITEKNKTVLENFLEIARTRYSVGKGIQQDVMKAEVELSRMIEKLVMLKRQETTVTAQLNTLLGRESATPLEGSPGVFRTAFTLAPETIRNASLEDHPLMRSVQSLQGKAQSAHSLAQREYYPDFEVTFAYAHREDSFHQDRPDFFSGFVGINLPIWHKTKLSRKVEEARYTILSAENRYEDTRNNLQFRISALLAEIDQNDHLINLYQEGIVPQATHTLNSSLASYQVGTVDFLTLLTNLLTLFRYELEYYRVLTDYEKNLADLELAMGKRLF
jgi:outer membrane protein TolC